jgi:hypothetical protein
VTYCYNQAKGERCAYNRPSEARQHVRNRLSFSHLVFPLLLLLYAPIHSHSMSEQLDSDAVVNRLCDRALEVVAKSGWLDKTIWSVSKALHAFVKPIKVVLADETPADIAQRLLLRSRIVAVQLEDNVDAPNPLPGGLHELILSKGFCGSVAELPQTLCSFRAVHVRRRSIAAVQSVLQLLPSSLQRLHFSCHPRWRSNGQSELQAAELSALPHLKYLHLVGVEWSTDWPSSLQELCLISCKVSDQLQLPVTLRKLKLKHCNSSRGNSEKIITVYLTEGLQHLELVSWYRVELSGDLPSTLTHLVLRDCSGTLSALLPQQQNLELLRHLHKVLAVLPSSLQVLKLGYAYTQPVGALPDTLTELDTGGGFNNSLGILPQSLKLLRIGSAFKHNLGPLPLHLERLHLGESVNGL